MKRTSLPKKHGRLASRSANQAPATSLRNSEVVLLALTGMSPAVLTETIWALANPPGSELPIIPDKVVVLTTGSGRDWIQRELFTPASEFGGVNAWEALRMVLLKGRHKSDPRLLLDEIRVIKAPDAMSGCAKALDDIRSVQDNEAAADFLLDEVRRITENPDTTLIASMAGGRKTLGALLYACVSLLGRAQDRLTHVLVAEPFENPALTPRFLFPLNPATNHQLSDPKTGKIRRIKSDAAHIELVDVPFVRLRELFPRQIGRFPGRFNALVNMYSQKIEEINVPQVSLRSDRPAITIEGVVVDVTPREYALYAFMLERAKRKLPTNILQKDCLDELKAFLPNWAGPFGVMSFQRDAAQKWKDPIEDDLRRQFSSLRTKYRNAGFTHCQRADENRPVVSESKPATLR